MFVWKRNDEAGIKNQVARALRQWPLAQYKEHQWLPELPDVCDMLVRMAVHEWMDMVMPIESDHLDLAV